MLFSVLFSGGNLRDLWLCFGKEQSPCPFYKEVSSVLCFNIHPYRKRMLA